MSPIPIFIGYDTREPVAYHVCANSIIRNSKVPVAIIPLSLNLLNEYTEVHTDCSNQFGYSRFLVPYLMHYQGWAIFMDGDMIVQHDIAKLWELRDETKDVLVVKHDYQTKMSVKYLGAQNENYPCKNWSSVMLINCASASSQLLTPEYIQQSTGSHLHQFKWANSNRIGDLPIKWNWLVDEFGINHSASLLHYTLGTPCFHNFALGPASEIWHNELKLTNYCLQKY